MAEPDAPTSRRRVRRAAPESVCFRHGALKAICQLRADGILIVQAVGLMTSGACSDAIDDILGFEAGRACASVLDLTRAAVAMDEAEMEPLMMYGLTARDPLYPMVVVTAQAETWDLAYRTGLAAAWRKRWRFITTAAADAPAKAREMVAAATKYRLANA